MCIYIYIYNYTHTLLNIADVYFSVELNSKESLQDIADVEFNVEIGHLFWKLCDFLQPNSYCLLDLLTGGY